MAFFLALYWSLRLNTSIGITASACPVCGSTILSAIGIAGGLAAYLMIAGPLYEFSAKLKLR